VWACGKSKRGEAAGYVGATRVFERVDGLCGVRRVECGLGHSVSWMEEDGVVRGYGEGKVG